MSLHKLTPLPGPGLDPHGPPVMNLKTVYCAPLPFYKNAYRSKFQGVVEAVEVISSFGWNCFITAVAAALVGLWHFPKLLPLRRMLNLIKDRHLHI